MSPGERRIAAIEALNALEADDFAPVLDAAAERCEQSAVDLAAAWQSKEPARVWRRIARALELVAGHCAKVAP